MFHILRLAIYVILQLQWIFLLWIPLLKLFWCIRGPITNKSTRFYVICSFLLHQFGIRVRNDFLRESFQKKEVHLCWILVSSWYLYFHTCSGKRRWEYCSSLEQGVLKWFQKREWERCRKTELRGENLGEVSCSREDLLLQRFCCSSQKDHKGNSTEDVGRIAEGWRRHMTRRL